MAAVECDNRFGTEGNKVQIRSRMNIDICPNMDLRRPKFIANEDKLKLAELKSKYNVKGEKG